MYVLGCQVAERLGNRLSNQKVAGSIPGGFQAVPNNVVSLGKTLHPTCFGGNLPVLPVSCSG